MSPCFNMYLGKLDVGFNVLKIGKPSRCYQQNVQKPVRVMLCAVSHLTGANELQVPLMQKHIGILEKHDQVIRGEQSRISFCMTFYNVAS